MKESLRGEHYASDKEVKTAVMKWLKEEKQNFVRQKYMPSSEGGTLAIERNGHCVEK